MGKYIIKRLILAFCTMFIILSLTFILVKLLPFPKMPGTDEQVMSYYNHQVYLGYLYTTNVEVEGLEYIWKFEDENGKSTTFYYTVPVFEQYFAWLKNIFTRWDWGTSNVIEKNVDCLVIIADRLPNTIKVNIISTVIAVPLGILLGIVAALNKNKPIDNFISTAVMVFISIPSFVLITFAILILGYTLKWLPTQWPNPGAPIDEVIRGYVIPVFVLSFGPICGYCRFTRAELCEVMSSEYLLLARTKGLTKKQAIVRHALKNSMVPIFPSILAEIIGVLGGSMILETLYGIRGIGGLFVEALNQNNPDYNVLFVDMCLFTTISLISGVFLDVSYGLIDPRIRMGAKK